jgi:site-specific recombinase XerD
MRDRTTVKKDAAPRGVFRSTPKTWAIRFTCGAGHLHEETIGAGKGNAIRAHYARRARALAEPNWCPRVERAQERTLARETAAQAQRRQTFRHYVETDYGPWAALHKKGWRKTERYTAARLVTVLGDYDLQEIQTAQVERMLDNLLDGRSGATRNRYRDLCSGMFKRAKRLGLVTVNPVTGIPKSREAGQRLVFLSVEDEPVLLDVLPARLRPAVVVAMHMGFRWGEQAAIRWRDVDMLTGYVTVEPAKGHRRSVPINAAARGVLLDLAGRRVRTDDPDERLFPLSHRQTHILFARAVTRAQGLLRDAGRDASRLDGLTWHGLRHTFASRLVMAGVDLRTVQELGGWRTLAMVQRYAHLASGHLQAAVDRIAVTAPARVELGLNLDLTATAPTTEPARVR